MTLVIDIGCLAVDNFDGVKQIFCAAAANRYTTFQLPKTVYYQVPGEKVFNIGIINLWSDTAGPVVKLGYGDNSVNESVAAPTNLVEVTDTFSCQEAGKEYTKNIYVLIPQNKYPCIKTANGNVKVFICGLER